MTTKTKKSINELKAATLLSYITKARDKNETDWDVASSDHTTRRTKGMKIYQKVDKRGSAMNLAIKKLAKKDWRITEEHDNMEDSAIQKVSPETRKMIMALRVKRHADRKQKVDKTKRLSVKVNEVKKERQFGWEHQKKIALRTLELSKVGANVLGGMTHAQAKHFLDSNGIKYDKRLVENNFFDTVRPGHTVHYLTPQGQERKGKVVMNQGTHLVLNRGDGQPAVVTQKNFIKSVDGGKVRSALLSNVAKAMKDTGGKLKEASDIEKQGTTDDHYGPGASNLNKAVAALRKKLRKKYDKNEDENNHSENAVLLAKHFGTPEELERMQHMLKTRNKIGHLHSDHIGWSAEMSKKYYHKLKEETVNELKKSTLVSYADKATTDLYNQGGDEVASGEYSGDPIKDMNIAKRKGNNRKKGIMRIMKRLAKENTITEGNIPKVRGFDNFKDMAERWASFNTTHGKPDYRQFTHVLPNGRKLHQTQAIGTNRHGDSYIVGIFNHKTDHNDNEGGGTHHHPEQTLEFENQMDEDRSDVEASAQRVAIVAREKMLKNRRKKKAKKAIKEEVLTAVDWDNVETSHHSVRASTYGGIPLKHHVARLMAAGIQSKPTHSPYTYHNGLLVQAKHRKKANKILFGADLPYNPMKRQLTTEVSAPGQEDWIKANKQRFIARYGKEKGTKILYAKAWKMSNQQESSGSNLPPVHQIARGIRKNWKKEYFGAVPYLDAMHSLETAHDDYGADTGHSVIAYGLSNMSSYSGKSVHDPELAKVHRAQLKAHLKAPKPIKEYFEIKNEPHSMLGTDHHTVNYNGKPVGHIVRTRDSEGEKWEAVHHATNIRRIVDSKDAAAEFVKNRHRWYHFRNTTRMAEGFKDLVRGIFSKNKEPKFFVHPERKTKTGVPNPTKFMTYGQFHKHLNPEVTEARESEFRANMHMGTGADLRKKGKVEPKKPHNQLDAMLAIHKAMKQARQGGVDESHIKEASEEKVMNEAVHYAKRFSKNVQSSGVGWEGRCGITFRGVEGGELAPHSYSWKNVTCKRCLKHKPLVSKDINEASKAKVKKTAERAIQLAKKKLKGNQTANTKPELQVPTGNAVNSTLEGNHAEVGDGVSNHV